MTLMSVRLGTDDVERAVRFHAATLSELDVGTTRLPAGSDAALFRLTRGLCLMLARPRDGAGMSVGNGDTLGFAAADVAAVDRWHAAGLASGGMCAGPPGPRAEAGGRYGSYLRDPDGHKLCAYAR